jgi:subtilisin family serine protease
MFSPAIKSTTGSLPAPGKDILTTVPRDSYDFLSGSSLAAAHVTGIVALLLEQRPRLTQYQIEQLLHKTVRIEQNNLAPQKRVATVDACRAIASLLKMKDCR